MRTPLSFDAFNVAPNAPRNTPTSWLVLAVGVTFLCASVYPLTASLQAFNTATAISKKAAIALKRQVLERKRAQQEQASPAAQDREKVQNQLRDAARMSWDGLFDALEHAAKEVHAGVSLLALVPGQIHPESTQLTITALAANAPVLLAYIETLKQDAHIQQVEMSTQQPEDKVGPSVIRFQLKVSWNPRIQVPRPAIVPAAVAPTKASKVEDLAILQMRRDLGANSKLAPVPAKKP